MARNKTFNIDDAIEKAMRVFREKGYEGASMQDLVDATGLSRSSIYETFGSKKDLYLVALDRYGDQAQDLTGILYGKGTAKELLLAFFDRLIAHNMPQSCLMVSASLEMCGHPEVKSRVQAEAAGSERAFYQLLARAASNGELKGSPDLRALAQFLVNARHGITVSAVTSDRQALDNIVAVTLHFLR
ncbi:transcriptional regulator, TetR family [Paenibacillus sp. UNC496MF]|uniref:TetR/AcrR family transcriptional regulator n=1 Tax=Paenibacillus sp. UNC496MF TaxID=1502753 RepID=UPI0008E8A0FF|nr:TetR/AcrR family transcriptional regulator [Paenibacillus sp. UNC496MF]SFI86871.1 transcriptional regulator, TetR family [Paenibacillus sp. UNC496MF]